ncbi:MAG: hypothetical protein AB1779_04330, partial [Candidatus Thermoplasmatota archaeon]
MSNFGSHAQHITIVANSPFYPFSIIMGGGDKIVRAAHNFVGVILLSLKNSRRRPRPFFSFFYLAIDLYISLIKK